MKKIILSAATIAVAFGVFAFAPVEKNSTMDNAIVNFYDEKEGCSEFYKTYREASECWSESTIKDPELAEAQRQILNAY